MSQTPHYWHWTKAGLALGLIFLATVAVIKPIGVSTQFVIFDGIIADWFIVETVTQEPLSKSGYASINAYLDKSDGKYAKAVAQPLNYSFVFVIAMMVGGFIGARFTGRAPQLPDFHRHSLGHTTSERYGLAFVGGVLVLWGARLAGGCTSGHMMSGMMQTAVSGYLFAAAAFAVAIPTALLLYRARR